MCHKAVGCAVCLSPLINCLGVREVAHPHVSARSILQVFCHHLTTAPECQKHLAVTRACTSIVGRLLVNPSDFINYVSDRL